MTVLSYIDNIKLVITSFAKTEKEKEKGGVGLCTKLHMNCSTVDTNFADQGTLELLN